MRQLAEMSGIHATTIQRIVDKRVGPQGASPETIQRLANALQVRESEVAKWAGQNWNGNGPYVPPKEADLLGPRQRKALNEIIKAMAELQRAIPTSGQAA
ncbi:helix-turn-helix transcriptional regulator [Rhodococcus qingshengii]|uniref:Helix-turn-helix transcriptional regulator n=1 Tax=Rhodococcus qingshengii TaxID=334542 RepID=A0AAW6LN76_RHOSG|nr:helix-turn-helix transcriptional regulator [Rhodococcus qingshengii]MDE8648164.1 helix-turn-helix transcriptional regulator [Rhodococcus qingshengii]